jgi:MarR family transcriptional regulator, organic hydroperoxide resistance regulator
VIILEHVELEKYISRLQQSFYSTMKKLGPALSDHLEEGLTSEQFFILKLLNNKSRFTASELAEEFGVKPSAITAMVDRMLKNDFVTRERDEKDRRVVYIRISEKGKIVFSKSENKRNQIMERYMSQLDPIDLENLVIGIEKLAAIVQETEEEST